MSWWAILAALFLAIGQWSVSANAPEGSSLVYALDVNTRQTYVSTFTPSSARAMFLLADLPHVLVARRTRVYYWSLTSRYMPDWESLNEVVEGTLIITDTRGRPARLTPMAYAFGVAAEPPNVRRLYAGEDAEHATRAFHEAYYAFRQAVSARAARGAARADSDPRPPQEALEPLGRGFVITLPAGRYRLALEDSSGQVVPGSVRDLVVFTARRQGTGYTVIPEQRWTHPIRSLSPDDALYHVGEEVVYLQPHEAFEVSEAAFRRMLDPQDRIGREERWIWVPGPSIGGTVRLVVKSARGESVAVVQSYLVRQRPGGALGYTIEPADGRRITGLDSGFDGLRLDLRHETAGRFWLAGADGQPLPGSQRTFSRVAFPETWTTLVALMPLGVAIGLYGRRRARRRRTSETGRHAGLTRRRT